MFTAVLGAATLAFMPACSQKQRRPHDDALKAQILSHDMRPIVLPPRAFEPGRLHLDADMRRSALEPSARDMEKRAPHFALRVKIAVDGPQGIGHRSEEHSWLRAPSGQFSVRHATGNALVEWLIGTGGEAAAPKRAFVRHGKGEWRSKTYTIEHADTLKRDVVQPFAELMATFADGVVAQAPTETRDNGRSAFRYAIDYDGKRTGDAKLGKARAVPLLKDDVLPMALSGDIVIDGETGLVLTADLQATLGLEPMAAAVEGPAVPPQRTPIKVKLTWSLDALAKQEAEKLEQPVPEEAQPERGFERPPPEILSFFGDPKKAAAPEEHDEED